MRALQFLHNGNYCQANQWTANFFFIAGFLLLHDKLFIANFVFCCHYGRFGSALTRTTVILFTACRTNPVVSIRCLVFSVAAQPQGRSSFLQLFPSSCHWYCLDDVERKKTIQSAEAQVKVIFPHRRTRYTVHRDYIHIQDASAEQAQITKVLKARPAYQKLSQV